MRRLILAGLFVLDVGSAWAQQSPKTYTMTVTADEASVILNDLSHLPWKDINDLMQKLAGQIAAQNAPATQAPNSAPKE